MSSNAFRTFIALPFQEKLVVLQACVLLQFHWAALKLVPYEKIRKDTTSVVEMKPCTTAISIQRVVDIVRSVSWRFPWGNTCLIRSLTSMSILERRGYSLHLKIGARKTGDQSLIAHAWLEDNQGQIVAEELDDLDEYSRLRRS